MRVYLKKNITAYSGKDGEEDVVYRSHNNGNICIASNFTKGKETAQTQVFRLNGTNIKAVWDFVSSGFKNDLKAYGSIYSNNHPEKIRVTAYSLFVKLMYVHAEAVGSLVSELEYNILKTSVMKSVGDAITANYFPSFGLTLALNNNM